MVSLLPAKNKENKTMGIIAWIVVGLIAGIIAKAIMPGSSKEPGGYIGTILLGIVGAVIGGLIMSGGGTGINLMSILVSVVGACIFIGLLRLFTRGTNSI